jgi:prefoldin subunit 5
MGWGGRWAATQPVPFTGQNQLEGLKAQAGQLEEALQEIRRQIEAIKESTKE